MHQNNPAVCKQSRYKEIASVPAVGFQIDSAEVTLIRRVQDGDFDAFIELVRPYERAVFLAALSLVRNDADAEDVAQEAILKAFKNLARFRQEAKFSTWLIQIAINEAKMRLRKERRHLYESIEEGRLGDDGDYTPAILPIGGKYHPRRWNKRSFAKRSPRPSILFLRNTALY
jgi:DNA-directed RNA polymerase specialized sigma24 family protein